LALLWTLAGAGCGPAGPGARPAAPVLVVGNSRDGTLTRIDPAGGRVLGPPVPGGEAPSYLAAGPGGAALALPASTPSGVRLPYVAPAPGGWRARPLPVEPGARSALLAGGGRFAAVAYQVGGAPDAEAGGRCRVALIDLARGQPGPAHDVCAGRDTI